MRTFWVVPLWAAALYGQQLSVNSATARRVELAWTGTAAMWTVERRTGAGAFEKVGEAAAPPFGDDKISAYATYHYRVRSQAGTPSNEVTVGPPPAGVTVPARVPKESDPGKYGTNTAPALAFLWIDPNGDNDDADNTVYFARWNRAAYSWKAPVKIGVVGDIPSQSLEPVSLACDAATGAFAVAYATFGTQGAQVALSRDGGATWQATGVEASMEGLVYSTALAVINKHWTLALAADQAGIRYLTGEISAAPAEWKSQTAPVPAASKVQPTGSVALTTDLAGKPLLAYWVAPEEGNNYRVMLWSPESGQTSQAADSNGQVCDSPKLRLNAAGGKLRLLLNCARDPKDTDFSIWYTASSGTTWSAPVKLPIDGPRSTNSPMALSTDSHGRIAAIFASNSGSGGTTCGYPVLSLSTDGVKWTTCGPGKRSGETFEPQPSTISGLFSPDDRLNIVWHQVGENKYGQGLLLWRE
jgi:hypothetical protein